MKAGLLKVLTGGAFLFSSLINHSNVFGLENEFNEKKDEWKYVHAIEDNQFHFFETPTPQFLVWGTDINGKLILYDIVTHGCDRVLIAYNKNSGFYEAEWNEGPFNGIRDLGKKNKVRARHYWISDTRENPATVK